MKYFIGLLCCWAVTSWANAPLEVEVELPKLNVDPYFRPYVAIWLETPAREPIQTIAVWHEKDTWLKDLRQWWRKLGRDGQQTYDAVSGATRSPGKYRVQWNGLDNNGRPLPAGEYLLNIEAAREEGGRSYVRERVQLGASGIIEIPAANELGAITITLTVQPTP